MDRAELNDEQLLEAILAGDREAFGRIVERYQSLVCAVAYGAMGSLDLSEDVAQETFVEAWKGMARLRDRTKLRSWLCGIARNLAKNSMRRLGRDAVHRAAPLEGACEPRSAAPSPREQAITREEETILWRSLEEIPETYREPLVLYYREQQSAAAVAAALDLSEDAVRQRLSRGRKMLKAQVAAFVEGALEKTRPGKAFTIAVLAALPAVGPQAAAAGLAAVSAKGSVGAKTAVATALSGAVWGPLLGLLGAFIGIVAGIVNTKSERERRFMIRQAMVCVALVLVFGAVVLTIIAFFGEWLDRRPGALTATVIALAGVYSVLIVLIAVRSNRRQRQIQIEEGTYIEPRPFPAANLSPGAVYGSLGGGIFGTVAWLFPMSIIAGDCLVAVVAAAVALLTFLIATRICLRTPRRYYQVAAGALWVLGLFDLTAANLRWDRWTEALRESPRHATMADWPLWMVNGMIIALLVGLSLMLYRLDRRHLRSCDETRSPQP